jgi:pimeloyl-ACP methyl ester carboxylesterase
MGSAVAQRFAIDNPENTLGLVLVSAVYSLPEDLKLQAYFDSTISKLEDPIDPDFVRTFLDSMRVKPISDELFEVLYHEALKVSAMVWIQAFEGRLIDNISEELGRIQSPTLLIWGDQDHRSLWKDQEAILAAIPDSRLKLYKGCGHLVHLEESKDFASDIANFLEEVTIVGAS